MYLARFRFVDQEGIRESFGETCPAKFVGEGRDRIDGTGVRVVGKFARERPSEFVPQGHSFASRNHRVPGHPSADYRKPSSGDQVIEERLWKVLDVLGHRSSVAEPNTANSTSRTRRTGCHARCHANA